MSQECVTFPASAVDFCVYLLLSLAEMRSEVTAAAICHQRDEGWHTLEQPHTDAHVKCAEHERKVPGWEFKDWYFYWHNKNLYPEVFEVLNWRKIVHNTDSLPFNTHPKMSVICAFLLSGSTGWSKWTNEEQRRQERRREGCKSSSETRIALTQAPLYPGEQSNKQTTDIIFTVLCLPLPLKQHGLTQLLLALGKTEEAT